ncbi:MAG: S8 family peptidase [Sarcina sp.]
METLDRFLDNLKKHLNNNNINEQSIEEFLIEVVVVFKEDSESFNEKIKNLNGSFLDLYEGFGIVTLKLKDLNALKSIEEIQELKFPEGIFFSSNDSSSVIINYEGGLEDYFNSSKINDYFLTGKGVLIGFIDSGIDFTHVAFKDFNDNTRIKYIYNVVSNKVFDELDINTAIKNKEPFNFLDERDLIGHGTMVASKAAAGGLIPRKYYGVANESNLMMVKLGPEEKFKNNWDFQIMKGIKFLIDRAKFLKMPLVINLSINSTRNNFWGESFLEEYLNRISTLENLSIVVSAGNFAETRGHYIGDFSKKEEIFFEVGENEGEIILNLLKNKSDKVDIKILNKEKESFLLAKDNYRYFSFDKETIEFYRIMKSEKHPYETIKIVIRQKGSSIEAGKWEIVYEAKEVEKGNFEIWLPSLENLNGKTFFYNSEKNNTIVAPALSQGVISVGSCNKELKLSDFSSLGPKNIVFEEKPNLIAEGEDVLVASGAWFTFKTGSSLSAAKVSGIVALLMEWGIVKGNDKELFGNKLKYFMQLGALRKLGVKYPNNKEGYGVANLSGVLELLENIK